MGTKNMTSTLSKSMLNVKTESRELQHVEDGKYI